MLSGTCSGDVGKDEDKRHELIKRRSLSRSMVQEYCGNCCTNTIIIA